MEDLSFNTSLHMLFQPDGVSPHYSCEVRQWHSKNYPGRCIGYGCKAPVSWPACSPDLHLLVFFFLQGYLKTKIYTRTANISEELWHRIKQFASEVKSTPGIFECL
jgi:hypothetical protein